MLAERPSTLLGVAEWVYRYPLRTVEAICNLADFGFRRWEFLPSAFEEISNGLFYCFTLAERPEHPNSQSQWQNQMAVFVIPPWLMSLDDFRDFVRVEMIRDFRTSSSLLEKYGEACYPTLLESLWVLVNMIGEETSGVFLFYFEQIFDYCERQEVQSFALTSYDQWVFGGFSYGKQAPTVCVLHIPNVIRRTEDEKCYARVSPLRICTAREPTIVQTLLFFIRNVEMRDIGLSSQWSSISFVGHWLHFSISVHSTLALYSGRLNLNRCRRLIFKAPCCQARGYESGRVESCAPCRYLLMSKMKAIFGLMQASFRLRLVTSVRPFLK